MEANEANLLALSNYLQNTLSPDPNVRKPAEEFLKNVETNEGYPRLLMELLQSAHAPPEIRVACSITFKNFVKRNWRRIEGESAKISDADRTFVRLGVIELLLTTPDSVQRQLAEAISLIGLEDFPDRWPELLPTLTSYFQSDDFQLLASVLQTANTLFKRYRHEMKSNTLWTEIKHVLDNFAPAYTQLFQRLLAVSKQRVAEASTVQPGTGDATARKEEMQKIFTCLGLIGKIFYSLNSQDLPEFFEDHMNVWMPGFLELLNLDVPLLRTWKLSSSAATSTTAGDSDDGGDDAGVIEHLHSTICDIIAMYAQKYEEEFAPFLPPFVEVVWHLLLLTGQQTRFDLLVANAIQFLSSVCQREQYKELFAGGNTLAQICERVILPNMEFRSSDEELFEDNPEEFIRKDIEGSDVDTRRRAASDFVKALCVYFEADVIRIFASYIQQLFDQYAADPQRQWAKKDAAVYLVVSLASRGQTQRAGATKTSELVNLVDFFNTQLKSELFVGDLNALPVLKADALKYIVTFRSQLPKTVLLECFPAFVNLLKADSVVVHTYAAHAIERLSTMRATNGSGTLIVKTDIAPMANDLLGNLFGVLEKPGSHENEYVMKCIMRSLALLCDAILPLTDVILTRLAQKLYLVSKNPSKPHFNHFLFESICVVIKAPVKYLPQQSTVYGAKFEATLFPIFEEILKNDIAEFIPYVFQILSMMLDIRGVAAGVPESYMALFPCLMVPALWERSGNIPALVKLLQAYIRVGCAQVAAEGKGISQLLGIFQKLITSPQNDHEGFNLLNTIIEFTPWEQFRQFCDGVLRVLFGRLSSKKTMKYAKGLIVFLCLFVIKYGATTLITSIDAIQADLFGMVVEKVFLTDSQKVSGSSEKKICCVGFTKLLIDCPDIMVMGKYSKFWAKLLESIIAIFELPEEDATDDEFFVNIEDTPGHTAVYAQLTCATRIDQDPTGVEDAKKYLASSLEKLNVNRPGSLGALFQNLDENAKGFALQYFNNAGISF